MIFSTKFLSQNDNIRLNLWMLSFSGQSDRMGSQWVHLRLRIYQFLKLYPFIPFLITTDEQSILLYIWNSMCVFLFLILFSFFFLHPQCCLWIHRLGQPSLPSWRSRLLSDLSLFKDCQIIPYFKIRCFKMWQLLTWGQVLPTCLGCKQIFVALKEKGSRGRPTVDPGKPI